MIEEKCLSVICECADEVMRSDSFLHVSVATLEKIVREDKLEATELNVFQSCVKWATESCVRSGIEVIHNLIFIWTFFPTDHPKNVKSRDTDF